MKAGVIKHIPPRDEIHDSARLCIEVLDEQGKAIGVIEIRADSLLTDHDLLQWNNFASRVDQAPRKAAYLKRYPLSAGEHNRYRVEAEIREDLDDWYLRQRRDRDRYVGIDPEQVRAFNRHR